MLDNQFMKRDVLVPVPEAKESSSSTRPGLRLSPLATRPVKTASKDSSKKSSEEHITDVRARQSPDLKSNQQRTFVPDFLVAWQESFPGYDPPSYTAQGIQASPTRADPDIMDPSNSSLVIKFNCDENGINRRSYCGEIEVVDRLPRWRMDENKTIVQKKGKQVLEFLAIKSLKDEKWAMGWKSSKDGNKQGKNYLELMPVVNPEANLEWEIPGGMIMVGDSVPEALTTSLRNTVVPSLKPMIAKDTLEGHLHTIIQSANEVVYKGYVDDPRNTDNAWLEAVVLNFHDDTRTALGDFEFEDKVGDCSVNWQEVSVQINVQPKLSFILHKVATLNNAFFCSFHFFLREYLIRTKVIQLGSFLLVL
ncbi:unnamed protein product [Porites evermanni]|uniref:Uncharacterized protein n=1 Tax=Porites evermanni TaxID=104178 RepID=A0ABN8M0G1_9CNID|nr:unnamed protein product [Porites evermanni]